VKTNGSCIFTVTETIRGYPGTELKTFVEVTLPFEFATAKLSPSSCVNGSLNFIDPFITWFLFCFSSVSIVSDYGLDDRAIEVRSPTEAKDFSSSPCVQTGSEVHPGSYPMGTGGPFSGGKARPGRDADHSPHLVPRLSMSGSYTSSPSCASMACSGTALLYFYLFCFRSWCSRTVLKDAVFSVWEWIFRKPSKDGFVCMYRLLIGLLVKRKAMA
jgi:hypothetical protein